MDMLYRFDDILDGKMEYKRSGGGRRITSSVTQEFKDLGWKTSFIDKKFSRLTDNILSDLNHTPLLKNLSKVWINKTLMSPKAIEYNNVAASAAYIYIVRLD